MRCDGQKFDLPIARENVRIYTSSMLRWFALAKAVICQFAVFRVASSTPRLVKSLPLNVTSHRQRASVSSNIVHENCTIVLCTMMPFECLHLTWALYKSELLHAYPKPQELGSTQQSEQRWQESSFSDGYAGDKKLLYAVERAYNLLARHLH